MSQPPYGPESHEDLKAIAVIDGQAGRRWFNALTLTLVEAGQKAPIGVAQQGRGAPFITKVAILFGFKNYAGVPTTLTMTDGTSLLVRTRNREATPVTRGDGSAVATITRGETTQAATPAGETVVDFGPDLMAPVTDARYRIRCTAADGSLLAVIDLIRTAAGWDWDPDTVLEAIGDLADLVTWSPSGNSSNSLPTLFLGTRMLLVREPTPLEREVLLAACVELGVMARAYFTAMGRESAWG